MVIVKRDSEEWDRMWQELGSLPILGGDSVSIHPAIFEKWRYMGTVDGTHSFRHRCHPITSTRMYHHIDAVEEFDEEAESFY
jgi:hypothetical protein